jgi:competence ComEA-like helix-hairpin-helix protein
MADKSKQGSKLDLNAASHDELAAVPGIGASTAEAIIAYRKQQGGFKKVDELEAVSGIGTQTLETLRGHFKLDPKSSGGNGKAAGKRPESTAAMSPANPETPRKAAEHAAEASQALKERGAEGAQDGAEALRSVGEPAARGAEAFASAGRRGLESTLASGSTMVDAARQLQQDWQAQMEENARAGQALASCRTPQDFLQVQADYARSSMERFVAEAGKLRHLTTRMMALGFAPLQTATRRNMRETIERTRG